MSVHTKRTLRPDKQNHLFGINIGHFKISNAAFLCHSGTVKSSVSFKVQSLNEMRLHLINLFKYGDFIQTKYLSPFLFGTDKAGLSSSHVSHLASSKRVPLRSLSTEKQKQPFMQQLHNYYVFYSIYQLLISLRGRFPLHRLPTQGHRQPCTFTFHVFGLCNEARESLHKQSKNTQTPHRKVPSWTADSNPVPSSTTVPTTVYCIPITSDSPRTSPGGHWHFPSLLRPPGQRIQPNPSFVTPCK